MNEELDGVGGLNAKEQLLMALRRAHLELARMVDAIGRDILRCVATIGDEELRRKPPRRPKAGRRRAIPKVRRSRSRRRRPK